MLTNLPTRVRAAVPDARRLMRTVLVMLLVGLVTGGLFGFVAAADDDPSSTGLDVTAFTMPAPRLGDHIAYSVEQTYVGTEPHGRSTEAEPWAELAWTEAEPSHDRDGTPRATLGLWMREPSLSRIGEVSMTETVYLVDPHGPEAFALRYDSEDNKTATRTGLLGSAAQEESRTRTILDYPTDGATPIVCGMLHPLQGNTTDLSDGIRLFPRSCRLDWHGGPWEEARFEPIGTAMIGDTETVALRYVPTEADPTEPPTEGVAETYMGIDRTYPPSRIEMTVWLAPDNPYPVRMEVHDAERDYNRTYRMTPFTRGDAPLDAPRPTEALPDVRFSPMGPHGLDETGVDHWFPASEAYQAGMDDPREPAMREWFADHPDAYVVEADAYALYDDGYDGQSQWWALTLSDDHERATFCIERSRTGATDGPVPADRTSTEPCRETTSARAWIPRSDGPTVASMAHLFHAVTGLEPDHGAAWGPILACDTRDLETCGHGAWFGIRRYEDHGTPLDGTPVGASTSEQSQVSSRIFVDPHGRLEAVSILRSNSTTHYGAPIAPSEATDDAQDEPQPMGMDTRLVWMAPGPALTAGALVLALVSGLAYAVWPMVKQGLLAPLFSRIDRSRALDHPVRAEIHAAIEEDPGIHFQALVRRTGHGEGTVQHHLGKLGETGLVAKRRVGGYSCYFSDARQARQEAAATAALKSQTARTVWAEIQARPRVSAAEIAHTTGLAKQTVAHHVKRLADAGLVERARKGRRVELVPAAREGRTAS